MNRQIFQGDVLEVLKNIKKSSVDTIISSPPYWGLRDYGVQGQLGLEPDYNDYLKKLYEIMNELKRILKKTGSCWINLGDTYSTQHKAGGTHSKNSILSEKNKAVQSHEQPKTDLNDKTLIGIPQRFYINCINSGWLARNYIPWYKSNSMPSSVTDRFANKWEPVYFFVKSKKYYFDLDSARIKQQTKIKKQKHTELEHSQSNLFDVESEKTTKKQDNVRGADGKIKATYAGFNERWKGQKLKEAMGKDWRRTNINALSLEHGVPTHKNGKNPGDFFLDVTYSDEELLEWIKLCRQNRTAFDLAPHDVFMINPQPFSEAHFATFPVELPKRILSCACPEDGLVLDPFFGSGTTAVAAEQLGLRWAGIELNPDYIEIAKKRLSKYSNKKLEVFV